MDSHFHTLDVVSDSASSFKVESPLFPNTSSFCRSRHREIVTLLTEPDLVISLSKSLLCREHTADRWIVNAGVTVKKSKG